GDRLDHDVEEVCVPHRVQRGSHHALVEEVLRAMQPWGIQKHHLRAREMRHAEDARPGRLWLVRDNRDLLLEKSIQKRRLPHIRSAYDRDGPDFHAIPNELMAYGVWRIANATEIVPSLRPYA